VDREATLTIARHARRLLIKTGTDVVRLDTDRQPLDDSGAERHLVHEDGFMRVPVLILGDLLVRGYTEELYAEALEAPPPGS
jgi:hypothetical protein